VVARSLLEWLRARCLSGCALAACLPARSLLACLPACDVPACLPAASLPACPRRHCLPARGVTACTLLACALAACLRAPISTQFGRGLQAATAAVYVSILRNSQTCYVQLTDSKSGATPSGRVLGGLWFESSFFQVLRLLRAQKVFTYF
jgi:hypothetical protein